MTDKVTAETLKDAICQHLHPDCVTATELNLGPSGSKRVDVYALKKTYRVQANIYEVKVTKQDFRHDVEAGKYEAYLPWATRVFFLVPKGLVTKDEVPDTCGLITWDADKGLHTVRGGPHRQVTGENIPLFQLLFRGHEMAIERRDLRDKLIMESNVSLQEQARKIGYSLAKKLHEARPGEEEFERIATAMYRLMGKTPPKWGNVEDRLREFEMWLNNTLPGFMHIPMATKIMNSADRLLRYRYGMFADQMDGEVATHLRELADELSGVANSPRVVAHA